MIFDFFTRRKVEKLLSQIPSETCDCEQPAVTQLIAIGEKAVPFLLEISRETSEWTQLKIVVILGKMGESAASATPFLIEQIAHGRLYATCTRSIEAIEKIGEKAVPHLVKALDHENKDIRDHSILLLEKISAKSEDALQELVNALAHPRWDVRASVAIGLGNMGERVLPRVLEEIRQGRLAHAQAELTILQLRENMQKQGIGNGVKQVPVERATKRVAARRAA